MVDLGAVLVVDSGGEMMPFASSREAELELEAVDVLAGEYADFGLDGEVVELRAHGDDVSLVGTGRWDREGLRRRVRAYSDRIGLSCDRDDAVAVANELLRRDWEVRLPNWPHWLDALLHGPGPTIVSAPDSAAPPEEDVPDG